MSQPNVWYDRWSLSSECAPTPRIGGRGDTLACKWGVGGVPILTTLPTLWWRDTVQLLSQGGRGGFRGIISRVVTGEVVESKNKVVSTGVQLQRAAGKADLPSQLTEYWFFRRFQVYNKWRVVGCIECREIALTEGLFSMNVGEYRQWTYQKRNNIINGLLKAAKGSQKRHLVKILKMLKMVDKTSKNLFILTSVSHQRLHEGKYQRIIFTPEDNFSRETVSSTLKTFV